MRKVQLLFHPRLSLLFLSFIIGLNNATLTVLSQILAFLGTPEALYPLAQSYLQINFLGIVFLFGYNFIGTVLRALGDSKTPIRFVLVAVVLNTIL
jgi:Na+-driven multidrug efflux pump